VLLTPNSFAIWKGFLFVLLGAHASCVLCVRHAGHTGSVRSQGRPLRPGGEVRSSGFSLLRTGGAAAGRVRGIRGGFIGNEFHEL